MTSSNTPFTGDVSHAGVMKILNAMAGLKFGSVEITVHEGRIVQIERKEKLRLNLSLDEPPSKAET